MDLKESVWFGQLQISGVGKPINATGSVLGMTSEFLRALSTMNPQVLVSGKSIILAFQSTPFAEIKSSFDQVRKLSDVESLIESSDSDTGGPTQNESYEDFYARLITGGRDPNTAEFVANDWFNRPKNPRLVEWLNDEKAILFRKLNTSHEAFEAAIPSEYDSLKFYVMRTYPEFCQAIVFRTA